LIKQVYAAGKKEKWNAALIKEMLSNPKEFEKYLIKVGFRSLVNLCRVEQVNICRKKVSRERVLASLSRNKCRKNRK
jgi:hypothetical protein